MKTVIGLFDDFADAHQAAVSLIERGYKQDDLSVIAHEAAQGGIATDVAQTDYQRDAPIAENARDPVGTGAAIGAGLGGLVGLFTWTGVLVIPGIGPVLALGPVLAGLAGAGLGAGVGAAVGGLVEALTQAGVPEHDAEFYAEAVRRGGTLVTVRTSDDATDEAVRTLEGHGAIDVDERRALLEANGYTGFRAEAKAMTADELARQREQFRTSTRSPMRPGAARVFGMV